MLSELEEMSNRTYTENGALTNRSTGSDCLNFFSLCGALRHAPAQAAMDLFMRAYAEDRNLAMKALFYARDVRGGLGERALFRGILRRLSALRPESVEKNIPLIAEYGRWDDLLALLGTPLEAQTVRCLREQLAADERGMQSDSPVSLLAKWLPSVNTSSPERRAQARTLCKALGLSEKDYRRKLSSLRTYIDVLEKRLCRTDYTFDYEKQSSGAMHKYRRAFLRHDGARYGEYLQKVLAGKATLHAGTLYPYEIVRACVDPEGWNCRLVSDPQLRQSLDASWKSLPDYGDGRNALAVVDGSGSMFADVNPMPAAVAMSLGIYFAEHNKGYFRDHFITFSNTPRLVKLKGEDIADRVEYCMRFDECANTDLRATFRLLLDTAVKHHLPQEELPETVYVISDMEFDEGTEEDATLFEEMQAMYEQEGYRLPTVVYWNVCAHAEQFPVRRDETGAVLVSGGSPSLFRMVISQEASPEQFMRSVLESERYRPISA